MSICDYKVGNGGNVMKKVTLKEFALSAKDNKDLKDSVSGLFTKNASNKIENISDTLVKIAKDNGYEITDIPIAPHPEVIELDDVALDAVVGGTRGDTHNDEYFTEICKFFWVLFGFSASECDE